MKIMPEKKYIIVSMEDERAGKIADVLGNKTCKKIIDLLAEKESSEKEIAEKLKIPINTAEYNLKKLLDSGLIEKTKNFFWSAKGKKVPLYKLSNKSIVISPKGKISSKLTSVLPALIIGGIGAVLIKYLVNPISRASNLMDKSESLIAPEATAIAEQSANAFSILQTLPNWYWFSLGVIITAVIVIVVNWRKL